MFAIPDPDYTLVLLFRIQGTMDSEKPACDNAVDLFWLFYNYSMDEPALRERVAFFADLYHQQQGGWLNQALEAAMVRGFSDLESLVNEVTSTLENLEKTKRVSYEPDALLPWQDLLISLHLMATRALMLKGSDEFSEARRELLEESWRTASLLLTRWDARPEVPATIHTVDQDSTHLGSVMAITGMTLMDQARIDQAYGQPRAALRAFALGLTYLSELQSFKDFSPEVFWNSSGPGFSPTDRRPYYSSYPPGKPLPALQELKAQAVVDVYEALRASRGAVDWRQVAEDRDTIRCCWDAAGKNSSELVLDSQGEEWEWALYWEHCCTWAETRLEPSELLEWVTRKEDGQAEERLKIYFFGDQLWQELSQRARQSLIDADATLFSGRHGRSGASLNDLRIAVEEVLYQVLWEPLSARVTEVIQPGGNTRSFNRLLEETSDSGKQPSLWEFERMCRSREMSDFLSSMPIDEPGREFITRDLPGQIRKLRLARRDAEHTLGDGNKDSDVTEHFRDWLGIGTEGMLPQVLAIKRNLEEKNHP